MAAFLRKYATGTGADLYIPIVKRAVVDFAVSADWTPASGDVKVSKDGAAAANIGTLPTAVTMGNTAMWKFVFTDSELTCAFLSVTVADSATKAVEDTMFVIETYGNASAQHAFDLDTATQSVNVTQFGGSAGTFSGGRPEVNTTHAAGTAWGSGAITAASIATGAIDADALAADTITAAKIASDAITAAKLAADCITAAKIADGAIDSGAFATGAITAAAIAADAITDAKVASDVTIASVTGAVGSVTGNVGGNVAGSVGSVTGNVGGNVTGTIGGLTAAALKDFFDTDTTTTYASAVAGSVVKEIADNAGGSALTVQAIVDGILDEDMTAHQTQGTLGQAIGDPAADASTIWGLVNTNLDAAVSSRLAPTTAGRTLDVTATGAAGIDWGNVENPTTAVNLSATNIDTDQVVASVSGAVGSVGTGGITRASLAADTGLQSMRSNTAAGGSASTITLDAGAPSTDIFNTCYVYLTGGTGAGQCRLVTAYDTGTKVMSVSPDWTTNPDNTSTFAIFGGADVDVHLWKGALAAGLTNGYVVTHVAEFTANSITAAALASDAVTEIQSGLSTLDAAGVRAAVGMASANLDTQLTAIDDYLDTEVAAIKAKTDQLTFTVANRVDSTTQSGVSTLDAAGVRTAVGLASANLDTQLSAIQADLPQRITKNTALSGFMFFVVLSSDHVTGATGKTVTATRSLDGAAFASCTNAVSEVSNGWYKIDLAAADLNGNVVALKFTATDCDARMITLVTQPT